MWKITSYNKWFNSEIIESYVSLVKSSACFSTARSCKEASEPTKEDKYKKLVHSISSELKIEIFGIAYKIAVRWFLRILIWCRGIGLRRRLFVACRICAWMETFSSIIARPPFVIIITAIGSSCHMHFEGNILYHFAVHLSNCLFSCFMSGKCNEALPSAEFWMNILDATKLGEFILENSFCEPISRYINLFFLDIYIKHLTQLQVTFKCIFVKCTFISHIM